MWSLVSHNTHLIAFNISLNISNVIFYNDVYHIVSPNLYYYLTQLYQMVKLLVFFWSLQSHLMAFFINSILKSHDNKMWLKDPEKPNKHLEIIVLFPRSRINIQTHLFHYLMYFRPDVV